VSSRENQADSDSYNPAISADGRFVVFESIATNLVKGDTNNDYDVFIRDLQGNNPANAIRMVSVNAAGTASGDRGSFDASVSSDGRFVAFRSDATDLVANDTNGKRDIFVRNMQSGVTTRVSVISGGGQSNGDSDSPSISQDGRFVVFSSLADNLVAGDTNGARDVFLHDTQSGTTTLISINQLRTASGGGGSASQKPDSSEPSISQDGRFVAFTSFASDLVTSDNNNSSDIFLYDVNTGALNQISLNTAGRPAQGSSQDAFARDAAAVPVHETVVVPSAGHFVMIDDPDQFDTTLDHFLRTLAPGTPVASR